jgi:hypothetical protein
MNTVIIGSGPAGLAFANYAIKANPNEKILIIEKDKVIGGCHKVNRIDGYFCEHGPRIYLSNYINFKKLLKSMDLDFNQLFIKKYRLISILNKLIITDGIFNLSELLAITRDFILVIFNNQHGINISMYDYMKFNNFSNKTIENIDLFCRTFDGGDSSKISLNQFISVSIQSLFYSVYVPRLPNDEGLFKYWQKFLENKKVKFLLNSPVIKIIENNNKIEKIILANGKEIKADRFIFAIPPENLIKIEGLKEAFKLTDEYIEQTDYNEYISITFHWDYKLTLEDDVSTFNRKTDWGLIPSNMGDYMTFKEYNSKSVISCAIILPDVKGKIYNKTANECNKEELFEETYEQLRLIYKNIPKPKLYFINNYYDTEKKQWKSNETAFIKIPNYDYLDFKSPNYSNLYNLGTHNGKHKNSFTSLESAISNSIKLSNIIYNKQEKIRRCFDVRDFTIVILAIIILIILWKLYNT